MEKICKQLGQIQIIEYQLQKCPYYIQKPKENHPIQNQCRQLNLEQFYDLQTLEK